MSGRSRLRRYLKRVLGAVFVLVLAVSSLFGVLLGTHWGRNFAASQALGFVNGSTIPGRIEVGDFSRLDLEGLRLTRVRVIAPEGNEVVRLASLEVDADLLALRPSQIRVRSIRLSDGFVDLRDALQPRRGLLAAFVDPEVPASPPSGEPPPYVALDSIELRRFELLTPRPTPIAPSGVKDLSLTASFELDKTPAAHLQSLSLKLERDQERIASVSRLSGRLARGLGASSIQLDAQILESTLGLRATGVLPTEKGWQTKPLAAQLDLSGMDTQKLARLVKDEALGRAFLGRVDVALDVSGSYQQLLARLELHSDGGPMQVRATASQLKKLAVTLNTPGFTPGRLLPNTTLAKVAARLEAHADLGQRSVLQGFQAADVRLKLSEARIDAEPLPELVASAELTPSSLQKLELRLADQASEVTLRGRAGLDTSADLDVAMKLAPETVRRLAKLAGQRHVDGNLEAKLSVQHQVDTTLSVNGNIAGRGLRVDDISLSRIDTQLDVSGKPPEVTGQLELRLAGLRAGGTSVRDGYVKIQGGPQRYRLQTRVRSNQGDVELLANIAGVTAAYDRLLLTAKASARREGQTLKLDVAKTELSTGAFKTEGITLLVAGQRLQVRGELDRRAADLRLEAERLDLRELSKVIPNGPPLSGHVSLSVSVNGALAQPQIDLSLQAERVAVGQRPALDVTSRVALDIGRGQSDVSLRLSDAEPKAAHKLQLALAATSSFSPKQPPDEALLAGEHQVRLELAEFDLAFLTELVPDLVLPVTGKVKANFELQGQLSEPRGLVDLSATLTHSGAREPVLLRQQLYLADQKLEASIEASDRRGQWVNVLASVALPAPEVLAKRPAQLLGDSKWRIDAALSERTLSDLPVGGAQHWPPVAVDAVLSATHEVGQEPQLSLAVGMRQTEALSDAGCQSKGLRLDATAALADGKLTLEVLGEQARRTLLSMRGDARLALSDALTGGQPVVGPFNASVKAKRLELGSLPFVCHRVAGLVDLDVDIADPLGKVPKVEAALSVFNLSAGSQSVVDAHVNAKLTPKCAELGARIRHGVNTSTASFRVPVAFSEGRFSMGNDARLAGKLLLKRLPIDPFVEPTGVVSYASGTLSGEVSLAGTRQHPKFKGGITLEDIGLTATELAQPLSNVSGRIEFSERELKVKKLLAFDKQGRLRIDGRFDFEKLTRVDGNLRIRAREFPLRQQGQVAATAELDARVHSLITPQQTKVEVQVKRADIWLESAPLRHGMKLDEHADIIVDGEPAVPPKQRPVTATGSAAQPVARKAPKASRAKPEAHQADSKTSQTATEIVLDGRERFWVKRNDFAVKLAALLKTRIAGDQVRVEGAIDIHRGYLELMGKVFEIERGSQVKFMASEVPDPVLKIQAAHQNRRSGDIVAVRISGRGSKPRLDFFVDEGAVTAGEAFVALFGEQRGADGNPEQANDQAKQFVGGLTAGVLATAARRELGAAAPIIMVEAGESENQVRAGFEFDDLVPKFMREVVTGVYFEGIVADEKESETRDANVHGGALLEIYLPQDFYTSGQYGPGSTWSVEVGWQP